MRAALEALQAAVDVLIKRAAARDQRQRVKIALQRQMRRQHRRRRLWLDGGVEADAGEALDGRELAQMRRRAAGKGDDRRVRRRALQPVHQPHDRGDAPALELGGRQHARPGIEDLHRFRARLDLAQQVIGGGVGEAVDQGREDLGMAEGEQPRGGLIRRAVAGDHVARHRPGRAAEADQRGLGGQGGLDPLHGLEHRREARPVGLDAQSGEILSGLDRRQARALAALEAHALAERVGHHQNVGEQDRGVEAEAADRLQRRLGGEGGRVAEVDEGARRGADFPVFREVAPGLTHQPHRRNRLAFAVQRGEKRLRRRPGGRGGGDCHIRQSSGSWPRHLAIRSASVIAKPAPPRKSGGAGGGDVYSAAFFISG